MILNKTTQNLNRLRLVFCLYCFFITGFATLLIAQNEPKSTQPDLDSVFTAIKSQLHKAEQQSDNTKHVFALINLANFYNSLGIANEAVKNYHSALKRHQQNDSLSVAIYNKLAEIHLNLKQYNTARTYLNTNLENAIGLNLEQETAKSYALLGSVEEKQSNFKLALQYEKRSLAIFKSHKDSTGIALTFENIGSIYEDLEQYTKALSFFSQAKNYAKHSASDIKINIVNNIGDSYRKMEQLNQALAITNKAYQQAVETRNTHQQASALKDISKTYAAMGNHELAYSNLIQHAQLNELELQHKQANLVNALQILYDAEEREAQIKLLAKENELNSTRQNLFVSIASFLFLSLVAWFLYFRKRKKQQTKIQHYKNELLQANLEKKTQEETALQREIEIKISALTNYSLHLAHKNKMISDVSRTLTNLKERNTVMIKSKLEDVIKDINSDLSQEQEWAEFISFFEQIHPHFFQSLKNSVTTELSPSEIRLCMLLRLNLSSKEIASILRITPDSVRIARYRLRKKLPIASKEDLQVFLLNL